MTILSALKSVHLKVHAMACSQHEVSLIASRLLPLDPDLCIKQEGVMCCPRNHCRYTSKCKQTSQTCKDDVLTHSDLSQRMLSRMHAMPKRILAIPALAGMEFLSSV